MVSDDWTITLSAICARLESITPNVPGNADFQKPLAENTTKSLVGSFQTTFHCSKIAFKRPLERYPVEHIDRQVSHATETEAADGMLMTSNVDVGMYLSLSLPLHRQV